MMRQVTVVSVIMLLAATLCHVAAEQPSAADQQPSASAGAQLRALLSGDVTAASRQLQQSTAGARAFSSVANHKTPQAPKMTRKTFGPKFPKRALLADALAAAEEDAGDLVTAASRQLQQSTAFASIANSKAPQTPRLTRKTFERKSPKLQ